MNSYLFFNVKSVVEIVILWMVFYRILEFFEGTRAFQVLRGITILIVAFLLSQFFGLDTLNWLLGKLFGLSIIAILVIFQPELRHGLARLGQQHLFTVGLAEGEIIALIEEVCDAVYKLSRKKTGCLIAFERDTKLNTYIESGVLIEAKISSALLQSIFLQPSPLHDGGVVARGDRIVSASCLFPLSENPHFSKIIGTRHRAALGLSEQTDAVIVMVSEETAEVSAAVDGRFIPVSSQEKLIEILKEFLVKSAKKKK